MSTKKNPQIDVIIPTYNGMPLLKEAVESVLGQTHEGWLLYVVDDGSTDNGDTARYVKSISDSRVHYLNNPKKGRSAARNHGVQVSKSPYIAFLDSDDIWYPAKLQRQLDLMEKNENLGMVYGLCRVMDEGGKVTSQIADKKRGDLFTYLLSGNNISGSASIVMLRREVFNKIGLFREDFSMAEDWELWLRVARSYRIDYIPEFLAAYRIGVVSSRPKFLEKARGLDYALPIMVNEFKLGIFARARLARACLGQACSLYLDGGDRRSARRTFFRMLCYNPLAWITLNRHRLSSYMRILFGNNLLRSLRRKWSKAYRDREGTDNG